MDTSVFKKMKLKDGITGIAINAPEAFIEMSKNQSGINFSVQQEYDYVHLFIKSKEEFETEIKSALDVCAEKGVLWISYPKSSATEKYDINRDILFKLSSQYSITPVSQVAIDEKWSAMRFKRVE
jgi:hypothetical protein